MFDWTDPFLLLPNWVFWSLLAVFCVLVTAVLVWVNYS
jgi:hypothetical protein